LLRSIAKATGAKLREFTQALKLKFENFKVLVNEEKKAGYLVFNDDKN